MRDTTWIKIADGVNAEVDFDLLDYERGQRVFDGRLTGRVQMHRDVVQEGRWGLEMPDDPTNASSDGTG